MARKIPEGKYIGRARGPSFAQFGYAESSGKEQVGIQIDLRTDWGGESVMWFGSFASEEAIAITMRTLRDLGWSDDSLVSLAGLGETEVSVRVDYEEYNGREMLRVSVFALDYVPEMKRQLAPTAREALSQALRVQATRSRQTDSEKAAPVRPGARR